MRTKNTRTIFGKLTVLAKMRHKKTTTYKYLCQCSCGNEIVATASNLYSGATTSCGCYDKERRKLPVGESMRNLKIYEYKKDAKRRNLIWDLTVEQAENLFTGSCFYCGGSPHQIRQTSVSNGVFIHNGIDRINNAMGYTPENCVSCCSDCNRAKLKLDKESFINHILQIHQTIVKISDNSQITDKNTNWIFSIYRYNALKRNILFNLSRQEAWRLLDSNCAYCGNPPSSKTSSYRPSKINGIDRLDNNLGYQIENCVPSCWLCNQAKGTKSLDTFLNWAFKVQQHFTKDK